MERRTNDPFKTQEVIVPPEAKELPLKKEKNDYDSGEWFVPTEMHIRSVFNPEEPDDDPVPKPEDEDPDDSASKRPGIVNIMIIAAIIALILMVVTATVILLVTTLGPKDKPNQPANTDPNAAVTTTLAGDAVNGKSTATTTTATSTTATTTTTMREQNGRVICATCSYVYAADKDHCPACANEGVSCDSICPTCEGAHNTDEGQAWEFCSFCGKYFVVTDGAVHTCHQCGATGLTPEEVDPVSGKCDACKNSQHHCAHCNALCDASLTYKGKIACNECYSYAVKNVCPHCGKDVDPATEMCPACNDGYPNRMCPSCGFGKFIINEIESGSFCEFCGSQLV